MQISCTASGKTASVFSSLVLGSGSTLFCYQIFSTQGYGWITAFLTQEFGLRVRGCYQVLPRGCGLSTCPDYGSVSVWFEDLPRVAVHSC